MTVLNHLDATQEAPVLPPLAAAALQKDPYARNRARSNEVHPSTVHNYGKALAAVNPGMALIIEEATLNLCENTRITRESLFTVFAIEQALRTETA